MEGLGLDFLKYIMVKFLDDDSLTEHGLTGRLQQRDKKGMSWAWHISLRWDITAVAGDWHSIRAHCQISTAGESVGTAAEANRRISQGYPPGWKKVPKRITVLNLCAV